MEELWDQTRDVVNGKPAQPKIFPAQVRGASCLPELADAASMCAPGLTRTLNRPWLQPRAHT